jgi:Flp pilus assembly protein TadD
MKTFTSQLVHCLAAGALVLTSACATSTAEKKGDTYQARKQLTRELIGRQDWPAAFFYADQLHRERAEDAEVLVLRGVVYRERSLPDEAERDLKEAIRLNDRSAEAQAALGILYDSTGRGELAEKCHRRAIDLAPQHAPFLNNLGFSLFLRKRHREAIEVYQRAVRINPTDRRVRTNLGFAFAAANDFPRAAREFAMGGSAADAKNNLGFAYQQKGDAARAYDLYVEALRLNPKFERAHANLVHVAQKLGKELPPEFGPAATAEIADPQQEKQ